MAAQDEISSAQAAREDTNQEPGLTMEYLQDFYRRVTSENIPPPQAVPQQHVSVPM